MRPVIRTSIRLLGIAAMAVLLSGCLKLTQDLTLNEDDTVDGEIVFAVSKSFLELSGVTPEDFLDQMTQGEGPLPEGVEFESEPYEDDDFVGNRYTFEGAPLSAFSDAEGADLSIVREGDMFVVSGTLDASSDEIDPSETPGAEDILDSFDVRISITFPGAVESSASGEIDGNTVTWTPALGETTDLSARGSAVAGGGGGGAPVWILLGAIVVLGVVVLAVVFGRKKGAPADASGAVPADTAISPTPGGDTAALPVEAPPPPPAPVTEPVPAAEPTGDLPDVDASAGDTPDGGGGSE